MIAVSAKEKKKKHRKSKSRSSHTGLPQPAPVVEESPYVSNHLQEEAPTMTLKESASSSSSRLSLDLISEDGQCPMYVALPKITSDLVSSEALAAADATALVLSAISEPLAAGEEQLAVGGAQDHPSIIDAALTAGTETETLSAQPSTLTQQTSSSPSSESQLRTAMLALSRINEDLKSRNRYRYSEKRRDMYVVHIYSCKCS